jgi:hypothetical protein
MFRFTIRDVLWLTVVVALGVAWLVTDARMQQFRRKAENYEHAYHTMKGHLIEQGRQLSKARQAAAENAASAPK